MFLCNPKLRSMLEEVDPKAVEQARKALGLPVEPFEGYSANVAAGLPPDGDVGS